MGVGTPGAIDPVNGIVCYANNLEFYNVPMAKMLKDKIDKGETGIAAGKGFYDYNK